MGGIAVWLGRSFIALHMELESDDHLKVLTRCLVLHITAINVLLCYGATVLGNRTSQALECDSRTCAAVSLAEVVESVDTLS